PTAGMARGLLRVWLWSWPSDAIGLQPVPRLRRRGISVTQSMPCDCWDMPPAMPAPHVAVVGGGIAGLACARALLVARPDLRVTVYESTDTVGGKLRLGAIAGRQVDLGAESMLNRRPEAVDLARAVGLGPSMVHPATSAAGIWTRGKICTL